MTPPPVPGCLWAADNLLVRTRKAAKLPLPQTLLRPVVAAGIPCVVNLLSKEEYLDAVGDAPIDLVNGASEATIRPHRRKQPRVFMSYIFWPETDSLPTARQVRQALEIIEDAHAIGLRVLVNGVGRPPRAALVAGCWLGREGHSGDGERLGWLEQGSGGSEGIMSLLALNPAERAFVVEWPTGREGQPELVDMEWSERDEVFPFASVEHWLNVLPTVRVYPGTRGRVRPVDVPVVGDQRVSDGVDIDLDLEELRRGTWIGERTLKLPHGCQVVFVSPRP